MHLRLFFHHRFIPNPSSHYSFLVRDVSLSLPHCPAFFHSIFGKWFLLEGNFAGFPHYHPGQRNAGTRKALYSGGQGDSPRLPQENTTTCCFGFPSQVITRDTHPVGDTYMPHGGKSDQFCQLKYWYSELLKKKKFYTVCSHLKHTCWATHHSSGWTDCSYCSETFWRSILSQDLKRPPTSHPSSICCLARQCLSVILLSKWTLATSPYLDKTQSETLNTHHATPNMATCKPSIFITTVSLQYLSFALVLIFPLFPFSFQLSFCQTCLDTSRPETSPLGTHKPQGHLERPALPSHLLSLTPPSASALPPVDRVEDLKQSWQGRTV